VDGTTVGELKTPSSVLIIVYLVPNAGLDNTTSASGMVSIPAWMIVSDPPQTLWRVEWSQRASGYAVAVQKKRGLSDGRQSLTVVHRLRSAGHRSMPD